MLTAPRLIHANGQIDKAAVAAETAIRIAVRKARWIANGDTPERADMFLKYSAPAIEQTVLMEADAQRTRFIDAAVVYTAFERAQIEVLNQRLREQPISMVGNAAWDRIELQIAHIRSLARERAIAEMEADTRLQAAE